MLLGVLSLASCILSQIMGTQQDATLLLIPVNDGESLVRKPSASLKYKSVHQIILRTFFMLH